MASKSKKVDIIFWIAGALIFSGVAILTLTFFPLAKEEVTYRIGVPKTITPIDTNFGIVIPKLGANAHVVANVDPFNSNEYQYALTKGVAHARETALPGTKGNMFLFAHSSENFYEALQYNSIFYLLNKLTTGDIIDMYYHRVKFVYTVTDKKFASPKEVQYLRGESSQATLTLMTCWPPGTSNKRLLIFATLAKE